MDFDNLKNNSSIQILNLDEIDKNIDIYLIQRNARKYTTIICGLSNDESILKNYAKDLRKILGCSCSLDKNDETQKINLKLSGKDTQKICSYLTEKLNIRKENIIIHGG